MALVKAPLGGIAASGTLGGMTFARNRAGQYARAWAKPVNPATLRQTAVRALFGTSSVGWASLTQAQVDAWDAYAAQLVRLNKLGEEYTPKGRQIFMETAQNLAQFGLSSLDEPSAVTDNPAMGPNTGITATETGGTIDALTIANVTFTLASSGDGHVVVEATPPVDVKLTNVNNLFRQVAIADGPSPIASIDLEPGYIAVFGTAALAGQLVHTRMRAVDEISGLGSSWLKNTGTFA